MPGCDPACPKLVWNFAHQHAFEMGTKLEDEFEPEGEAQRLISSERASFLAGDRGEPSPGGHAV
jgi:hypothetical protein